MGTKAKPFPFERLPTDIQHLILASYLDFFTLARFRATNRHFHSLLSPMALDKSRRSYINFLMSEIQRLQHLKAKATFKEGSEGALLIESKY